jgi:hypothetical protein
MEEQLRLLNVLESSKLSNTDCGTFKMVATRVCPLLSYEEWVKSAVHVHKMNICITHNQSLKMEAEIVSMMNTHSILTQLIAQEEFQSLETLYGIV